MEKVKYNQAIEDILELIDGNEGDNNSLSKALVNYMIKHTVTSLDNYSWEEISTISRIGLAEEYFNIGDIKTFKMNNRIYNAVIIGFKRLYTSSLYRTESDGKEIEGYFDKQIFLGKNDRGEDDYLNLQLTSIVFGIIEVPLGNFQLHCENTNKLDYKETTLNSILNNYVYLNIEEELRNIIQPIYRGEDYQTSYKLFALTEKELTGKNYKSNEEKDEEIFPYFENENNIKKYTEDTTNPDSYWTASKYKSDDKSWIYISRSGHANNDYAENRHGITFAFCI